MSRSRPMKSSGEAKRPFLIEHAGDGPALQAVPYGLLWPDCGMMTERNTFSGTRMLPIG